MKRKKPEPDPEADALHAQAAADHVAANPDTRFTEAYLALAASAVPDFLA